MFGTFIPRTYVRAVLWYGVKLGGSCEDYRKPSGDLPYYCAHSNVLDEIMISSVRADLKHKNPQDLFRDYHFWVACEADEELPHLLSYIGEDHIVIGSDYGHNDPSKEPEFVKNMRAREDVSSAVVEKILSHNARALYGLS